MLQPGSLKPALPQLPLSTPRAPGSSDRLCPLCSSSSAWGQGGNSPSPGKYHRPQTLAPGGGRVHGPAQGGGHRGKSGRQGAAALVYSSRGGYRNFHKMVPAPNLHRQTCCAGLPVAAAAVPGEPRSPTPECTHRWAGTCTLTHLHSHPHTWSLLLSHSAEFSS